MGKRTVAVITDDHDGKAIEEADAKNPRLILELEGQETVWDLFFSPANCKGLETLIRKYCAHAEDPVTRPVTGPQPVLGRKARSADPNTDDMRRWYNETRGNLTPSQWAKMELPDLADKGRIPNAIVDAYYREYPQKRPQTQDQA